MSVPIKRLQELVRRVPASERRTVERFMEFVIAGGDGEAPTPEEAAMINVSREEIARGDVAKWEPGMLTQSKSPRAAANKLTAPRRESDKPSK